MGECCIACKGVPFKHRSNNGTHVSNEVQIIHYSSTINNCRKNLLTNTIKGSTPLCQTHACQQF